MVAILVYRHHKHNTPVYVVILDVIHVPMEASPTRLRHASNEKIDV